MHTKLFIFFVIASVSSRDISIGTDTDGRKIFDEIRQANPAIWRQIENVTIIAPDDEAISRVVVTDMRPEKDGDAQIVDGGEGKKSVTIELKSPTVLRGYEFHLEVYTVPETKFTDAEEHLYGSPVTADNRDVSENSETTMLPEIEGSGAETKDSEMSDDKNIELPDSSTNKVPALVGIVDGDILRPARQTGDENVRPEISKPDISINSNEDTKDSEMSDGEDKTTETPDSSTEKVPAFVGTIDGDILRPARQAMNGNVSPQTSQSDITNESDVTTERVEKETSEGTTTEADLTTKLDTEEITFAPVTFDNSKNIPDYPALDILGLIKSKEGTRRIRRIEDENNESDTNASTTENVIENKESSTTSLPIDSSSLRKDDDTIDLLPPIETEYNTQFSSNDGQTEKSTEIPSTYNRPRAGRGLDFGGVQDQSTSVPTTTLTSTTVEDSEISTTESTIVEQERNTRDTNDGSDTSNLNIPNETTQNNTPLCSAPNENEKPDSIKNNIIVLNGNQLTLTDKNLQYGIPIILIIGSERSIPTIKIIAEDSDVTKDNNQPSGSSLEENAQVPEYKLINDDPEDENPLYRQPVLNFN